MTREGEREVEGRRAGERLSDREQHEKRLRIER